MSGKNSCKI